MYKVFVKDIPIILSSEKSVEAPYETIPLASARFKHLVKKIHKGEKRYVHLYDKNAEKLEHYLKKKIPFVVAAGGLVENDQNELLFIYRNKRWDLPKGHVEPGEDYESAAIREVEEETGVQNLVIKSFLTTTYHVFKRKGEFRLKVTYWYKMATDYKGDLAPQIKEGIHKAKWKNFKKSQKALSKSYANIRTLFPSTYLTHDPDHRIT